jgi:formylglycine-generating enzyme required for sulfatase activity
LKAYPGGQLSSPPENTVKAIRGGSWQENSTQATGSYRGYMRASGAADYSATGFRCVKEIDATR